MRSPVQVGLRTKCIAKYEALFLFAYCTSIRHVSMHFFLGMASIIKAPPGGRTLAFGDRGLPRPVNMTPDSSGSERGRALDASGRCAVFDFFLLLADLILGFYCSAVLRPAPCT